MVKALKIFLMAILFLFPAASAQAVKAQTPSGDESIKVVVIDPGHGGDDTGAKGPSGIPEKEITLSIALKVAEALGGMMDARVLLTRTTDVFIPLEERTAFANGNRADVFISIHANAARSRDAHGTETFFLSMDATDEDARRLAAFENSADSASLATAPASPVTDDLKDILLDLANTRSHHESSRLAEIVHTSMLGRTGREGRGVKQAPFTVLVGATMPAVLVEVGFISNPTEEKWLTSKKDQEKAAKAIAEGVVNFRDIMTKRKGFIEVSGTHVEN